LTGQQTGLSSVAAMGGKRAKPSPWRFVRAAPIAVVAVVVWVMVGLFLLLPGSGSDQAHDWGLDPIPSASSNDGASGPEASSSPAPEASTSGTTSQEPAATSEPVGSPGTTTARTARSAPSAGPTASELELRAGAPTSPVTPSSSPTSEPTDPLPTQAESGPPTDNPGKKKGHHKPHGPTDDED
jgi:eukaryotic-like serine/threonine-protein kinase